MLPAFLVLTLRPHELTRKQLKELSFALDLAGFTAINLQAAWQETTNEDSDRCDTNEDSDRVYLRPYSQSCCRQCAEPLQRSLRY
jgi:hypothetical protein